MGYPVVGLSRHQIFQTLSLVGE